MFESKTAKVAVITGAGAGIGRACAVQFAQKNYNIVVTDLSAQGVERTCRIINENNGKAVGFVGDIALEGTSKNLSRLALEQWGRIDALVANAGVQTGGSLLQAEEDDWNKILGVNLKGVAYSCKSVLPAMIEQGKGAIVMTASVNAVTGSAGMAIYDASKAGVLALMRNLAVEHGAQGIRVNAVCPGNTITDFHINRMAEKGIGIEQIREMTKGYGLLGRAAEPSEIADAIYFLASEQAAFITGQALPVDGGFSLASGTQ